MITLAAAIIIAFSPNEAGGRIALTNERGDCGDQHAIFSFASNGNYATGCYVYREGLVIATWEDGSKRIYDIDTFELSEAAKAGIK